MKHNMNNPVMSGIMLCLATTLLFSCKKNQEEITSSAAPVTKGAKTISTSPVVAESPAIDNKLEETSAMLFPGKSVANNRLSASGVTDYVDFDDEMALSIIPDYAASTFATDPFYIQQVGNAWVHVKENNSGNYAAKFKSNYGHFHLSFQNFLPCYKEDGWGKPVSGGCASINPIKEPRVLDTHDGDEWIKIYAYDYSNPSRTFDLLQIQVTKSPIQLWFKKSNGEWAHWSNLTFGTWNLGPWCTSIKEVLISSTGNKSPIGFDNLKVSMPAF